VTQYGLSNGNARTTAPVATSTSWVSWRRRPSSPVTWPRTTTKRPLGDQANGPHGSPSIGRVRVGRPSAAENSCNPQRRWGSDSLRGATGSVIGRMTSRPSRDQVNWHQSVHRRLWSSPIGRFVTRPLPASMIVITSSPVLFGIVVNSSRVPSGDHCGSRMYACGRLNVRGSRPRRSRTVAECGSSLVLRTYGPAGATNTR